MTDEKREIIQELVKKTLTQHKIVFERLDEL